MTGSERESERNRTAVITGNLKANSYRSTPKIALSLGITTLTIDRYMTEVWRINCQYLCRGTQMLTSTQHTVRVEWMQGM
jgi:hypothetical protein